MGILFTVVAVVLLMAAIGIWVARSSKVFSIDEGNEQQKWLQRFYEDEPSYCADLVAKYGFLTGEGYQLFDRRYDYLPIELKVVQLDKETYLDRTRLEQALKRARQAVNQRAYNYRKRIEAAGEFRAKQADLNNLMPVPIGELDKLNQMAQSLGAATKVEFKGKKH